LTQLRRSRQNRGGCWTPSQNTTPRMHLEWQKHWGRSIRAEGDYFDGDSVQSAKRVFLTRLQHQSRKLWSALCIIPICPSVCVITTH
jgi:hypothetical protein